MQSSQKARSYSKTQSSSRRDMERLMFSAPSGLRYVQSVSASLRLTFNGFEMTSNSSSANPV